MYVRSKVECLTRSYVALGIVVVESRCMYDVCMYLCMYLPIVVVMFFFLGLQVLVESCLALQQGSGELLAVWRLFCY